MATDLLPLALLAPVLAAVAYFDLRFMRIPNVLVLVSLGLFLIAAPFLGWAELSVRLIAAGAVLVVGFGLFAAGMFGGGDAKMMAALMLFVPAHSYILFGYVFSAAMLFGICLVLLMRRIPAFAGSSWVSMQQAGTFPMGISIALCGLLHPLAVVLSG